jgi:hypothetical protein
MPNVRKGESRSSYVSRAVDYMVHVEGMKPKHAVGRAEGMYDQYKKKRKK